MSKRLTPREKLTKAVYGTLNPTPEQVEKMREKLYEMQANSVTDEDYERITGHPIKQTTDKMMLFVGWCEAVSKWDIEHHNDKKYHASGDFEPRFSYRQVVDLVQMFYEQGQADAKIGVAEYDRLWRLNKLDIYVTDEKVTKPKFIIGDELHHNDYPNEKLIIRGVNFDYYVEVDWAVEKLHLPFEYVEKNYEL